MIHSFKVSPQEAIKIQRELAKFIDLENKVDVWKIRKIAGLDVAYSKRRAFGGAVVVDFPTLNVIEIKTASLPISFPYIPGLLTFREGPVLMEIIKKLREKPDLFLFNGLGVVHPRKMGLATHMGILIKRPTIGVSKGRLKISYELERELKNYIKKMTRGRMKIYISCGYQIDVKTACQIIKKMWRKHNLPEPLFWADQLSKYVKNSPLKRISIETFCQIIRQKKK